MAFLRAKGRYMGAGPDCCCDMSKCRSSALTSAQDGLCNHVCPRRGAMCNAVKILSPPVMRALGKQGSLWHHCNVHILIHESPSRMFIGYIKP